jgi:hypothetical protein
MGTDKPAESAFGMSRNMGSDAQEDSPVMRYVRRSTEESFGCNENCNRSIMRTDQVLFE